MQAVFEIITAISFAILIILGITAWYCWHKYNNAEDREVTEKYEKVASIGTNFIFRFTAIINFRDGICI